jgi:hypothetical protein
MFYVGTEVMGQAVSRQLAGRHRVASHDGQYIARSTACTHDISELPVVLGFPLHDSAQDSTRPGAPFQRVQVLVPAVP